MVYSGAQFIFFEEVIMFVAWMYRTRQPIVSLLCKRHSTLMRQETATCTHIFNSARRARSIISPLVVFEHLHI